MKKESGEINLTVKVIYSGDSNLREAYQFLAKKIIDKEKTPCKQQYMSE